MHRDYKTHTPTKLYQYSNRIEIINAGGLYGNARPENFPNVNDYRNPIVAEGMKTLGYVNMFNRGISRVQKLLEENGNGRATFVVDRITTFEVHIKDASLVEYTDTEETDTKVHKTGRKEQKQVTIKKILQLISKNPQITRKEIATAINISLSGLDWYINYLKKEKILNREGQPRNGQWIIIE